MEVTVARLDLIHELSFAQPAFTLARNAPEILQIFYETIAPRYPVPSEHISVNPANVLSEKFIRIGLFGNAVALELRADKMTLRFPLVVGEEGLKAVKDIAALAYDALNKGLPGLHRGDALYTLHIWLALGGGSEEAQKLLRERATPHVPIDPKQVEAETVTYSVRANIQNTVDHWDAHVYAEPSAIPQAHLFVLINVWFRMGTTHATLDQQIPFVEKLLPKILASLGTKLKSAEHKE